MNNRTKKEHFVPQFYLRGFANAKKKDHYIYVYNKKEKSSFSSNIIDVAQEQYFYDIGSKQIAEKLLSKFEDFFNIILIKLTKSMDLDLLSKIDKKILSDFIAIQYLRTQEHRIMQKEIAEKLINIIGKNAIPNYQEHSVRPTEEFLKSMHINSIFDGYNEISEIILKEMTWKLCINNTETPFWTSDNPCAVYNELEPEPFKGNLGLRCKGFQMHFPLSSKLLLLILNPDLKVSDLKRSKTIKDKLKQHVVDRIVKEQNFNIIDLIPDKEFVSKERVTFENNLQIFSSTQFIYSQTNDFDLANKYLDEYSFFRDTNRKRIRTNFDDAYS